MVMVMVVVIKPPQPLGRCWSAPPAPPALSVPAAAATAVPARRCKNHGSQRGLPALLLRG